MTYAIQPEAMPYSGGGWAGHGFRVVVLGPKVVAGGDSQEFRLRLRGGSGGFSASSVWVGKHTGGNTMASPVQAKWGGSSAVVCPPGSSEVVSDWFPGFPFSTGQALMVGVNFSGTSDVARTQSPESANYDLWFKPGATDAGDPSPSGYTNGSDDRTLVVSLELRAAAVVSPVTGSPGVRLWRPPSTNCLAGTVPTLPSYTPYDFWSACVNVHMRRQKVFLTEGGQIAVFGCSGPEALVVSPYWSPWAQNYGIGGELLSHFLNRLPLYTSLSNTSAVVLKMGVNDIGTASPDMALIKDYMMRALNWVSGPVVWIAETPTKTAAWKDNLNDFNSYITAQISGRPNVRVVNVNAQLSNASGLLKDEYADDNEHLNANGQLNVLAPAVVDALKSLGVV